MSLKKIVLDDHELYCDDDESLHDALVRENLLTNQNCQQNRCENCLVRCVRGLAPPEAQIGLREELRHQNYFLACLCFPQHDMIISMQPIEDCFTEATVIGKSMLNSETLSLTVQCKIPLSYYAGQFVNLKRADGLTRSYAITNSPPGQPAVFSYPPTRGRAF